MHRRFFASGRFQHGANGLFRNRQLFDLIARCAPVKWTDFRNLSIFERINYWVVYKKFRVIQSIRGFIRNTFTPGSCQCEASSVACKWSHSDQRRSVASSCGLGELIICRIIGTKLHNTLPHLVDRARKAHFHSKWWERHEHWQHSVCSASFSYIFPGIEGDRCASNLSGFRSTKCSLLCWNVPDKWQHWNRFQWASISLKYRLNFLSVHFT